MSTTPSASTFTLSTSNIAINGGSVDIVIDCADKTYSHKLRHEFGAIATIAAGTTKYTWKPTAEQLTAFFKKIPTQNVGPINITLDTYNGTTLVGSNVRTLTLTLTEATGKPVLNSYTIKDISSDSTAKNMGIWVYGKSKTTSTNFNIVLKYGSTLADSMWRATHSPTDNSPMLGSATEALNYAASRSENPVQVSVDSAVKDSRGFWSNIVTNKYYVAGYKAPHIDTFEVLRCNTSGVEDDGGIKAKVVIKGSWAAMKIGSDCKNAATLKVGYRVKDSTEEYAFQAISVSDGIVNVSQLLDATFAEDTDYDFSVTFSDAFSESDTRSEVDFNNVGNIFYVSPDGKQIVVGSNTRNNVSIDEDSFDIRDGSTVLASFMKDTIEIGKNSEESLISMRDGRVQLKTGRNDGLIYDMLLAKADFYVGSNHQANFILMANDGAAGKEFNTIRLQSYAPSKSSTDAYDPTTYAAITIESVYSHVMDALYGHINLSANSITINSQNLSDFVIDQGTSGKWHYRKWNSGRAECWGMFSYSFSECKWWTDTSYVKYGYPAFPSVAYPFTFSERPQTQINYIAVKYMSAVMMSNTDTPSTTTGDVYVMIPDYSAVGGGSGLINIYACGKYQR